MKLTIRRSALIPILWLAFFLGGCASVPLATPERDSKSKQFLPAPNKASVYIYRNENFGAALRMLISINGKILGQTAAKTYFQIDLKPGRYKIESTTENVSSLNLSLDAGRNYFIWQEVKMGVWAARSALQQVDENVGRLGVMESKQIASAVSEDELEPMDSTQTPATAPISVTDSLSKQLQDLQNLRANNRITEEEYQKMRTSVIEKYQK